MRLCGTSARDERVFFQLKMYDEPGGEREDHCFNLYSFPARWYPMLNTLGRCSKPEYDRPKAAPNMAALEPLKPKKGRSTLI